MAPPLTHKLRGSGRGGETTYTLDENALTWEKDGDRGAIRFADIKQVNLKTYAADIVEPIPLHGQMILKTKSGQRLKVHSHHYQHIGSFESRVETYGVLCPCSLPARGR